MMTLSFAAIFLPIPMTAISIPWSYDLLLEQYGPQYWWPAQSPFEVIVGAVLTQNTAWTNVEKAITNLKLAQALTAEANVSASPQHITKWLKPSGYFNVKAKRLKYVCQWYLDQGGYNKLSQIETTVLREALLSIHGVGKETADDILLYAFNRDVFVIDSYTRRLLGRLGLIAGDEMYEALRHKVEQSFAQRKKKAKIYNEFHALIVRHAKDVCKVKPKCEECGLALVCARCGV